MPKVSIKVQADTLERFSDLELKASQALAEFIDNAIQSYLDHKNNNMFLRAGYKLKVDVDIDWFEPENRKTYAKSITIRDNAAGITKSKYDYAFETGRKPDFNDGLNEYGMGMKVAAFWFCKKWTTISKYYAENVERTLVLDLDSIVSGRKEAEEYTEKKTAANESYTIVKLENLYQKQNFTKAKLKGVREELASIYRSFLRRGEVQINVDGEALVYEDLKLLEAPYYENPQSDPVLWRAQIHSNMFGKEISGYIGILDEMSEKQCGLVILRRGRVIVGESADHRYNPDCIFGKAQNAHRYKRLYGEIEIKGFSASFNKNGFSNVDELETMLDLLRKSLTVNGYDLIKQAENLRKYKIRWKFNNGEKDKVETYFPNAILHLPEKPTLNGYEFKGWSPALSTRVNEDREYSANWQAAGYVAPVSSYTVVWNFDNGTPVKRETYSAGDLLVIPSEPQKLGHSFMGWVPKPNSIVKSHAEYTARWQKQAPRPVPPKNPGVFASRSFSFKGTWVRMDLLSVEDKAAFLTLSLEKYESDNIILGYINPSVVSVETSSLQNKDVQKLMLSFAIAMFKTQMSDADNCTELIKHFE